MRVVVAELGADLVKLTPSDASCLGEGLGMCVGSRGTWKKMRVLVAKVGAVLVRSTPLDASFLGSGQGYVSAGMRNTESDASAGHQSGTRPS